MANVKVVMVGGGGGGGKGRGGGGGAGGYLPDLNHVITPQAYSIVIGGGGNGATDITLNGADGGNTTFDGLTAYGGGGGNSTDNTGYAGNPGASGGGTALWGSTPGGAANHGSQGYAGGGQYTSYLTNSGAGGGGGASEVGKDGGALAAHTAGAGGAGIANPISGSTSGQNVAGTYYLAGGGGGSADFAGGTAGAGGNGGGGAGGTGTSGNGYVANGTNGTANTGGGGGGGSRNSSNGNTGNGGNGGTGVVVISYPTGYIPTCTGGTITTAGGKTIHTFTTDGTFTVPSFSNIKRISGVSHAIANDILSGDANLVQYTEFEGNSTATVGANGTDTAITYSTANGRFGQGAGIGTNGYITLGTPAALAFERTSAFSISAWVYLTDGDTEGGYIFSKQDNDGSAGYRGYHFRVQYGHLHVELVATAGSSEISTFRFASIIPGIWTYVVMTYDGSGSSTGLKTYKNATPIVDEQLDYDNLTSGSMLTTIAVNIGNRHNNNAAGYFHGKIDSLGVFNDVLTQKEIFRLYSGNIKKIQGKTLTDTTITYISSSSTSNAASTSIVVPAPANLQDGDVMITCIDSNDGPSAITTLAGWTQINKVTTANGNISAEMATYYKVASSESGNYTWTTASSTRNSAALSVFRGVKTTAVVNTSAAQTTASSATQTAPTITPTVDNCMLVFCVSSDATGAYTYTPPTGYTEAVDIGSASAMEIAYKLQTTAAATGAVSATCSTASTSGGFHIALTPISFEVKKYMGVSNV